MRARVVLAGLLASAPAVADPAPVAPAPAPAAPAPAAPAPAAPPDLGQQAMGVSIGFALGGRNTPGGLRVEGHYLYQMSRRDWFDATAAFTQGALGAQCFYDRSDAYICDHGVAHGTAVEVTAAVRHFFRAANPRDAGTFWPFVRGGIGLGYSGFGRDHLAGFQIPVHVGAGVRVSITPALAIIGDLEVLAGVAFFDHDVGTEPQLGLAITAGVEFRL